MNIEKNQILTLDNNENYFVAGIINYKDEKLALLVNMNADDESFIVKINDELLTKVEDNDELYKLFKNEIN